MEYAVLRSNQEISFPGVDAVLITNSDEMPPQGLRRTE
jgi:hypothetical protein